MVMHVVRDEKELLAEARQAEVNEDLKIAEKSYEQLIRQDPHYELAYDRLMVIYRKQKRYEDELKLINKGLKTFGEVYKKKQEKFLSKHKELGRLSNALIKKAKLSNSEFVPQPLGKWLKRKEMVEKKIKGSK
jgi:tetratricopeptide (TPR) repeat protein